MRSTVSLLQILTGVQIGMLLITGVAAAQNFTTVQEKVRRPVAEIRNRDHRETTYEPEYTTEMKKVQQTYLQPVVRYQLQRRLNQWWNPLSPNYTTQYAVPVLQWEPRVVTKEMAVTTAKLKPVTRVVSRPTRILKFVEENRTRVVQTPAPVNTAPLLARRQQPLRPVFQVNPQPAATAPPVTAVTPSRVSVRPPAAASTAPAAAVATRPVVNVAPGGGGVRVGGGTIAPSAPANTVPTYQPPAYRQPVYAAIPAPTYNARGYQAPAAGAVSQPAASVAENWGGVSRLETDPPRFGRRLPGSGSGAIIR